MHAYVGDAVIVTWPLNDDPERNAALRCFFAAEDRMELAPVYAREFGVVPSFCAGVHAGAVVVSECGDARRQIAFFGDTMNVAARLCDQAKSADQPLLVSADLLRNSTVPPGLTIGPGASVTLRGRQVPVEIHPVHRSHSADRQAMDNEAAQRDCCGYEILEELRPN